MNERYPKLINTPDRGLVRESVLKVEAEAARIAEGLETEKVEEVEEEDKGKISHGRRAFLKSTAVVAGSLAMPDVLNDGEEDSLKEETARFEKRSEELEEKGFIRNGTEYQLAMFGEVVDMQLAIEAKEKAHYTFLSEDEKKGIPDMKTATENICKLDVPRFVQPFIEKGLQPNIAYMIAIQETRGVVRDSWAGAKGITGIMPNTAKAYGLKPEEVNDPYKATEISAKYFVDEKSRFGDNLEMLCHAYNGGANLFGFTRASRKKERTPENFYKYMEKYINIRYAEIVAQGYYVHKIDSQDKSLTSIGERFGVKVQDIIDENGMKSDVIRRGDSIKIPYDNPEDSIEFVFRKPLEVLNYTPEIKAKYDALKQLGLTAQIEEDLDIKSTEFVSNA